MGLGELELELGRLVYVNLVYWFLMATGSLNFIFSLEKSGLLAKIVLLDFLMF